ncbi:mitogen-activated protein kinase kinase kinase NPK1-like isoform X1 [Chenopodium quinoa]|uniref:mitogen-activated protein kinase kinase kinase NPK1-like isoform X1 n=1 Tax=Chenopodium quinoa TaxID=63459 RepID=UPI000B790F39|nr:mitogen-activated protein kinase kinase kinase NPK1-like isoform X1 [Chenopodium quinoa]
MQELFGSVRRSLVFRTSNSASPTTDTDVGFGGFVDKIGSSIRKSRIGLFATKSPVRALPYSPAKENMPPSIKDEAPPIRWRKGELIGCGAFGRVYMGMNIDSGELLAVKQVSIASGGASREKTQAHIRELEEEVKLLRNLSHTNIVRYLGTAREEEALNILLEFVPGGSISSLLGKFGSFPESVIRMYTKQLLLGLEYLHKNGIMHRDIKGANILVDNKGCIKLADFGASKKVVELATMTGAKSMKGTPHWMAPEVILQTGHNFSADIWSVGCTIIEMATGKPPWCQYQEVQALFHIGTTKSHPPIPEHLSADAKDFLIKCLQKEPYLRASASELLQHPFVTGEYRESQPGFRRSVMENSGNQTATTPIDQKSIRSNVMRSISGGLKDICNMGSVRCSTVYPDKFSGTSPLWGTNTSDDDMCIIDDKDDFAVCPSAQSNPTMLADDFSKSFNPMCEPNDDWPCKFDDSPEVGRSNIDLFPREDCGTAEASCNVGTEFTFPSEALGDDDEEVTESKIQAFLNEKAFDLKKLQEEFYNNTINVASPKAFRGIDSDAASNLPSKIKSPAPVPSRRLSTAADVSKNVSPASHSRPVLDMDGPREQPLKELPEIREIQKEGHSSSPSFSERQKIWKEELDKELEMERERLAERLRQAGGKTSSPNKRVPSQQRERLPFASPPK